MHTLYNKIPAKQQAYGVLSAPAFRRLAIHEAGHAVARVLVAPDFGLDPTEMVEYVELRDDGSGACCGRKLSADLREILEREHRAGDECHALTNHLFDADQTIFEMARNEGVDVDGWLIAHLAIQVAGGMALALTFDECFAEIWDSRGCSGDQEGIKCWSRAAGQPHKMIALECAAIDHCRELLSPPEVLAAINAVADELVAMGVGTMPGDIIADTVLEVLKTAGAARDDAA